MPISEMDIRLTKELIKQIDIAVQGLERRTKSCDVRGIIFEFESANEFIKQAGPMVVDMRMAEPENKEISDMSKNFASIYNRHLDVRHDFENKCVCSRKQ